MKDEYKVAGGRCKQVLYLFRHRCVYDKAFGWRCKWCGASLVRLNKQRRIKRW